MLPKAIKKLKKHREIKQNGPKYADRDRQTQTQQDNIGQDKNYFSAKTRIFFWGTSLVGCRLSAVGANFAKATS